jgi:hypothetical protein
MDFFDFIFRWSAVHVSYAAVLDIAKTDVRNGRLASLLVSYTCYLGEFSSVQLRYEWVHVTFLLAR